MKRNHRFPVLSPIGWVLLILLLITLSIPGTREMHIMVVRLLLYLQADTIVQGQPPGCRIYVIPNIQFSRKYETQLRNKSSASPESYIQAAVTGNHRTLTTPPVDTWRAHPLLLWATLQRQALQSNATTNSDPEIAPEYADKLIQFSQTRFQENGVPWLLEGASSFALGDDKAAIKAIKTALKKKEWIFDHAASANYIKPLLEQAGLSELDAAVEVQYLDASVAAVRLMGNIKRGMEARMTSAIKLGDTATVIETLNLWQKLAEVTWAEDYIPNRFRIFAPSDDLLKEMAMVSGISLPDPEPNNFKTRNETKKRIQFAYLSSQIGTNEAQSFLAGSVSAVNSIQAEREKTWQTVERNVIKDAAFATLSGAFALFFLAGLGTLGSSIAGLRIITIWPPGTLSPIRLIPLMIILMTICTCLFASVFIAMGPGEVGFGIDERYYLTSNQKGWLFGLVASTFLTGATCMIRRSLPEAEKKFRFIRQLGLALAYSYLLLIICSAYFRSETVRGLAFGVLD